MALKNAKMNYLDKPIRNPKPPKDVEKHEEKKMNMLGEVYKSINEKDFEKAYQVATKLFHKTHTDKLVFETKMNIMITMEKFVEAYEQMLKFPELSADMQYEMAYCLYRLQEIEKAKEVLEGWKDDDSFKKKELLTQVYYRLDRYEEAYDMMRELIRISDDDMDDERQTNLSAIVASLKLSGSTKDVPPVLGDSYELEYNHATALIGAGKLDEADLLLNKVEKSALQTLIEEDAPEEDIADEVGLVMAQKAYCAQVRGREKEAMSMYTEIMKKKPTDTSLIAVVSNNIICINGDQNLFDSKKRVKNMSTDEVVSKLNRTQRRAMWFNEFMLNMYSQNYALCESTLPEYVEQFPEGADDYLGMNAAFLAKSKGIVAASEFLDERIPKDTDKSLLLKLGLCQQMWKEGSKDKDLPLGLLKELVKKFVYPGIVGAIVTMYQSQNNNKAAAATMKAAVEHYRKTGRDNKNLTMLWRQMACLMIEQEEYKEAARTLEELRVNEPNDGITLAQLIVAYSQFDTLKAKALAPKLPKVEESEVDVDVLESPNWLANMKTLKRGGKPESLVSSPIVKIPSDVPKTPREKKKKKKKAKLPANYDPNRRVDPERWLPRFERTGYRPKKTRKGRVDVGKGTQGADTNAAAMYDMSGKVGQRGSSVPEDSPATSAWRKDGNKKKQKRSRR